MNKTSILKIGLLGLTSLILLTGCGKTKQPELKMNFNNKSLKTYEQVNLTRAMVGWSTRYHKIDTNKFTFSPVYKDEKSFFNKNYDNYLNEYIIKKKDIDEWRKKVQKASLNIKINNEFGISELFLEKLIDDISTVHITRSNERLFVGYKEGKEKNIDIFLNDYRVIKSNTYKTFSYNKCQAKPSMSSLFYPFISTMNQVKSEKNYTHLYDFYCSFIPSEFTVNDKFVSLEVSSISGKFLTAVVSNKTNSFIDLSNMSVYYDGSILTIPLKIKLPPMAKTLYSDIRVELPSDKKAYLKVEKKNQKVNYGFALEYYKNGKKLNLYKTKDYSISSL